MPFSVENFFIASFYLGVVGAIVLGVQLLFHFKLITGEYSRKLIHILTALWMATWRFDMPYIGEVGEGLRPLEITYLGLALLVIIFLVKQFKWFNSIFDVDRITYGEFIYIVAVIATASIFPSPEVYALAIINLGVADGLAAVVGMRYGRRKYDVFGSTKSIAGMLTSFTIVMISGTIFWIIAADYRPELFLIVAHVIATAAVVSGLEFVSFKGLDNLTIPLATGLLYTNLIF
ncbi:hypothetical protein F4X86_00215 [Candidatus Saccharibacteria bacterium]|nr:hypothetical protein [Candidatus Saccharibacteria bacterium]